MILSLLQNMSHQRNKTVIIVTHNAALAQAADKVIRIKNGEIESVETNKSPKSPSEIDW